MKTLAYVTTTFGKPYIGKVDFEDGKPKFDSQGFINIENPVMVWEQPDQQTQQIQTQAATMFMEYPVETMKMQISGYFPVPASKSYDTWREGYNKSIFNQAERLKAMQEFAEKQKEEKTDE